MVLAHDAVFGDDIQVLHRLIDDGKLTTRPGGTITAHGGLLTPYRKAIVQRNAPLARRFKVVVDCGNGDAGVVGVETPRGLGGEAVPVVTGAAGRVQRDHP